MYHRPRPPHTTGFCSALTSARSAAASFPTERGLPTHTQAERRIAQRMADLRE
jgi:hypothetical protein